MRVNDQISFSIGFEGLLEVHDEIQLNSGLTLHSFKAFSTSLFLIASLASLSDCFISLASIREKIGTKSVIYFTLDFVNLER